MNALIIGRPQSSEAAYPSFSNSLLLLIVSIVGTESRAPRVRLRKECRARKKSDRQAVFL